MCIRDRNNGVPVSYIDQSGETHPFREEDKNNIPVSYTHLDVYKRQAAILVWQMELKLYVGDGSHWVDLSADWFCCTLPLCPLM